MATKRVLILANSVKKGQHCIAGREIIDPGATMPYGNWIRPVSRQSEGELTRSDCAFENSQLPRVWDVVDVPVDECEGSVSQPENWFIDPTAFWVKVGDQPGFGLPLVYAENPPDLWFDPNDRVDRVSPVALAALNRNQSLYLVAVTDFRIEIDWHSYGGYHRRRAQFRYASRHYDLSLTDPAMESHCSPFPPRGQSKIVELPTGGDKILCVSLTPEFNGYHYKVVATVLETTK
jgi:hypothetical protein